MSAKHTPGPWIVAGPHGSGKSRWIWRRDEGDSPTAETNSNYACIARHVNCAADARLIAAAPDMLAALESYVALLPSSEGLGGHAPMSAFIVMGHKAREAIAKAKGE